MGQPAKKRKSDELTANPLVTQTTGRLYPNRDKTGDVKFLVDGEIIRAHKCVLATLSPKYEAQFYGGFNDKSSGTIEVKEVSAAAFNEFLQFFYLDRIEMSHKNIDSVLDLVKASLVDEFFTVCIDFLTKKLSVESVCKTYSLAMRYECDNLIDRCEEFIRLNSEAVFSSNEFNQCCPVALSNILQFDSLNCKEMVVFNACINWAKIYCTSNGLDASNHQHLRRALGSAIFNIRFGTMTIEEFMRCYQLYKNIFSDAERDGILYAIGNVVDPKSSQFNDEPRDILFKKWDDSTSIECDRVLFEKLGNKSNILFVSETTTFSCNQPCLLGTIYCGALAREKGCDNSVRAEVVIIRKRQLNDTVGKTLLAKTHTFLCTTKQQAFFKLQQAIKIRPDFFYEIQLHFKGEFREHFYGFYGFNNLVQLDRSGTVIDFHNTKGVVTGLLVNICGRLS